MKYSKVIKNQEKFFDMHAHQHDSYEKMIPLFDEYVNKQQYLGLDWVADKKIILDYGCGTGSSLDRFTSRHGKKHYQIFGVDISQGAIDAIGKKYPRYKFFKIKDNKLPLKNGSLEAVYMMHILHHTHNHPEIFKEIYNKLEPGGKFSINDLCSNNPINKFARSLFTSMPKFVKSKFGDDLQVEEGIPDKYKVSVIGTIKQLKSVGFKIERVGYGHLFFFIFIWIDKFIPFSKVILIRGFYKILIKLEEILLHFDFFKRKAEVFYIEAVK